MQRCAISWFMLHVHAFSCTVYMHFHVQCTCIFIHELISTTCKHEHNTICVYVCVCMVMCVCMLVCIWCTCVWVSSSPPISTDPLRPLWPAIGIIACLIITVVLIVIGTKVDDVIAKRRAANASNGRSGDCSDCVFEWRHHDACVSVSCYLRHHDACVVSELLFKTPWCMCGQ